MKCESEMYYGDGWARTCADDTPATFLMMYPPLPCGHPRPARYMCDNCMDRRAKNTNPVRCRVCNVRYPRNQTEEFTLPVDPDFIDPTRKEEARAV